MNSKRVLYQSVSIENRSPVLALTNALEQIKSEITSNIIPKLTAYEGVRKQADKMVEACNKFDDTLTELPLDIRRSEITAIGSLQNHYIELIKKALLDFRNEFLTTMITMLTEHKVSIPKNIIYSIPPLSSISVPEKIYVEEFPVLSNHLIYYAGVEQIGYFLRIITLAESRTIGRVEFPKGTETIFYNPKDTNNEFKVCKATLGEDLEIDGKMYSKGSSVYFDVNGNVTIESESNF